DAPWESASFYYCGLAYHYMRNYEKAKEKYAQTIERFPGTDACTNASTALKALDPGYLAKKNPLLAGVNRNAAKGGSSSVSVDSGASQDRPTVEGVEQARITYMQKGFDNVVDLQINGHRTRAIFDKDGEATTFSKQQLASMGIAPDKGATEMKVEVNLGGAIRKNFPITIDDSGAPARIGAGFFDAYTVKVDEPSHLIELKRKGAGSTPSAATAVSFTKDAKDIIVTVDVNGHQTQMIYEPGADGVSFTAKQAKAAGLKVDEAEEQSKSPNEGPARGEPGWVPPEDRAAGPKSMSVRMSFGPIQRSTVSCQIHETGAGKYPKFGSSFVTSGGYQPEIDYKSSKIVFTRK
ncbi:MAG: retropepsin-like domain-containing protein, partial [Candidatus Obscuribacterales bacterium]|nr:retropepsin-like domain-containing protein [Candidatus Obscuribacterales bacterium]